MTEAKQKQVTVSGNVIQSTIDTMESFGRIGQEILQSHGISEIRPNDQYPYELRSDLHKIALDRFGEIALVAFGFQMGDSLSPVFVDDMYRKSNSIFEGFKKNSRQKKIENLEDFLADLPISNSEKLFVGEDPRCLPRGRGAQLSHLLSAPPGCERRTTI